MVSVKSPSSGRGHPPDTPGRRAARRSWRPSVST